MRFNDDDFMMSTCCIFPQQKAKVDQQHRVKILVSKLVSVNEELLKLYEDKGTLTYLLIFKIEK